MTLVYSVKLRSMAWILILGESLPRVDSYSHLQEVLCPGDTTARQDGDGQVTIGLGGFQTHLQPALLLFLEGLDSSTVDMESRRGA